MTKARRPAEFSARAVKADHPLQWLADPLLEDPTFVLKAWFGGRTIMIDGKHRLFLTTQDEPWQGILVCTEHDHQASLRAEIPALTPHPVLKKWLYLPESCDSFERDAKRLVMLVRDRDPRIGVSPSPRKKPLKKKIRFGDRL